MMGSGTAPSGASQVGPAVGRERSGVEGGLGLELTSMGTLYHYLLTGQTDKWKNRHMDKQTAREKEQDTGVPLLLHNRTCHRHHQNGRGAGAGKVPCPREGDRGEEESTSSVRPEGGRPEWQSRGGGGRR